MVHLLGFAFCREQFWPLLVTCNPMQAPPKVTVIRRQNAFLFYLFSYPVDYVLWINLAPPLRVSACTVRGSRSTDARAAEQQQQIPCFSWRESTALERFTASPRRNPCPRVRRGMDCLSPLPSSGATPPIPPLGSYRDEDTATVEVGMVESSKLVELEKQP